MRKTSFLTAMLLAVSLGWNWLPKEALISRQMASARLALVTTAAKRVRSNEMRMDPTRSLGWWHLLPLERLPSIGIQPTSWRTTRRDVIS